MRSSRRGAIQAPPLPFRNEYPQLLNDYSKTEMQNDCKKHKTSPQNSSAAGFAYVLKQPKIPYFKRFLGIEKVHRNSIKITVDLWRRVRDSNPRCLAAHDFSRVAPSTTRTTLQVVSSPNPLWKMGRTDGENSKIFSFSNPRKPA